MICKTRGVACGWTLFQMDSCFRMIPHTVILPIMLNKLFVPLMLVDWNLYSQQEPISPGFS